MSLPPSANSIQGSTNLGVTEGAQAHLAAVVEWSDDAIISKSLSGIIGSWNRGAERLFGYSAEEAIASAVTMLLPLDRINEETEIIERLKRGERIDHFETVRLHKNGTQVHISLSISPIKNADGEVVGASTIARDIAPRRIYEAELQRLLESERAARAEAERLGVLKDEFLATLSHELRTPLNAILGWSQLLASRGHEDDELSEGLAVIERNARAQTRLIEDLLDMSRIINGKIQLDVHPTRISDVVEAALETVRHSADAKGITLKATLDPLAAPVLADASRLQQCFWNLLSNAIKFTVRGGTVQVSLQRASSHLEFCVADNGIGIHADFLPHVFERFRQADPSMSRSHAGLGLGLAIVKHLVELHGGRVHAKSAGIGAGATFCIALPIVVIDAADWHSQWVARNRDDAVAEAPSLNGISVLAVDDEPDTLDLVKRVLEACGAQVLVACSAEEALKLLVSRRPDMIVSDIGMPGEDGNAFMRKVRALSNEAGGKTPAAALSAFARTEERTRALRSGYQTHLAKPVESSELAAVVASLTGRN